LLAWACGLLLPAWVPDSEACAHYVEKDKLKWPMCIDAYDGEFT
jgi:hypothetical protein